MAALLAIHRCPSCGGIHDFCDPDGFEFLATRVYGFTCPVTEKETTFAGVFGASAITGACPPGAVRVRRIGDTGHAGP